MPDPTGATFPEEAHYWPDHLAADAHDWEPEDDNRPLGTDEVPQQAELERAMEQARQWHEQNERMRADAQRAINEDTGAVIPGVVQRARERLLRQMGPMRVTPPPLDWTWTPGPTLPPIPPHFEAPEPRLPGLRDYIAYGVGDTVQVTMRNGRITALEDTDRPEASKAPGVDFRGLHSSACSHPVFQSAEVRKDYLLGASAPDDVDFGGVFGCTDSPSAYAYLQRGG